MSSLSESIVYFKFILIDNKNIGIVQERQSLCFAFSGFFRYIFFNYIRSKSSCTLDPSFRWDDKKEVLLFVTEPIRERIMLPTPFLKCVWNIIHMQCALTVDKNECGIKAANSVSHAKA